MAFTTSPLPPHPLLLRILDIIFPRRYAYDAQLHSLTGASPTGAAYHAIVSHPTPDYPFNKGSLLATLFPPSFYRASLRSIYPIIFAIAYYVIAHALNRLLITRRKDGKGGAKAGSGGKDYVSRSKTLQWLVIAHNAFLMVYSAWTWIHLFPVVVDYYFQGFRAAGYDGWKAAMATFSVQARYVNRYNYLFYLSKYYEVIDSIILLLKGKKVGQLQSYHHAGALISMWIAVRFGSANVWVFTTWNAFVHTLMYTYYLCAAMRWRFPRALKKSLTTLQICQIASGTIYTNLHWIFSLDTTPVMNGFSKTGVKPLLAGLADRASKNFLLRLLLPSALVQESTSKALSRTPAVAYSHLDLLHNVKLRAASKYPTSCFDSTGAVFALHVNTLYMLPLLMLFAQFFIRSYLAGPQSATRKEKANGKVGYANGKAKSSSARA